MTARERFLKTLRCDISGLDRLPMVEWAPWWDLTLKRWVKDGLDAQKTYQQICDDFELDFMETLDLSAMDGDCPQPASEGAHIIKDEKDYNDIIPFLYNQGIIDKALNRAREIKEKHESGKLIIRVWLDGFFWFPRKLFGIEAHLYSFYDNAKLMHRINSDLAAFNIRILTEVFKVLTPDMVGFAEDMSYNHGPMLSKGMFDEFLLPYYKKVIPVIKEKGIKTMLDSDGNITEMIPWIINAGIEGIYPLERQSGVDVNYIRENYPEFLMMGGYDKMVMAKGEKAMRREFERILPAMKSGGYIPSVDHQTPPGVSLENYRIYIELFKQYTKMALE